MNWASYASDNRSLASAVEECVDMVKSQLQADVSDLAVVFVSSHHSEQYAVLPQLLSERLETRCVIGCSAGGVIGGGSEIEQRPGLSITCALLPDVQITPFHFDNNLLPDLDASPQEWEELVHVEREKSPQFLLITDPFTVQTDNLIMGLDYAFADSIKVGGMASGGRRHGDNVLILNGETYRSGAIGLAFSGDLAIDPIVAQGCRPIGEFMRVTKAQHNLLIELEGVPTLEVIRNIYGSLNEKDQELVRHSLFLGVVMDEFKESPELGDFLIRNILGMDSQTGALSIGDMLREGQIVQFHLRDARTSAEDLEALLKKYSLDNDRPTGGGALLFSCLGRGEYLYGRPNHDTELFRSIMGNVPIGGFFCNGEIGPVGDTTYLHGYTSSFGIFRPK